MKATEQAIKMSQRPEGVTVIQLQKARESQRLGPMVRAIKAAVSLGAIKESGKNAGGEVVYVFVPEDQRKQKKADSNVAKSKPKAKKSAVASKAKKSEPKVAAAPAKPDVVEDEDAYLDEPEPELEVENRPSHGVKDPADVGLVDLSQVVARAPGSAQRNGINVGKINDALKTISDIENYPDQIRRLAVDLAEKEVEYLKAQVAYLKKKLQRYEREDAA